MSILDLFKKRNRGEIILSSIFKIAEKGMCNLQFPGITKAGQFEILMFDIWLGTEIMREQHIDMDYKIMQDKIEEHLKLMVIKLGLPSEKKYERAYIFRTDGWLHDIMGLMKSDYPKTKQFIPGYMHSCIIVNPLIVYDLETTYEKMKETPLSDSADFLFPFCEHYSWLVKEIMRKIN